MSDLNLPEAVLGLVAASGSRVVSTADGVVDVGDAEIRFVVHEDAEIYSVEKVQRGVLERVVLRTPHADVLWRFFTITFGGELRSRAGWPPLRLATGGTARLPHDCELERIGPRRFRLRWSGDGRPGEADELIEIDAIDLAWTLGQSLENIAESFRHRDGFPAFPQQAEGGDR